MKECIVLRTHFITCGVFTPSCGVFSSMITTKGYKMSPEDIRLAMYVVSGILLICILVGERK